jgi:hypothetical protein
MILLDLFQNKDPSHSLRVTGVWLRVTQAQSFWAPPPVILNEVKNPPAIPSRPFGCTSGWRANSHRPFAFAQGDGESVIVSTTPVIVNTSPSFWTKWRIHLVFQVDPSVAPQGDVLIHIDPSHSLRVTGGGGSGWQGKGSEWRGEGLEWGMGLSFSA